MKVLALTHAHLNPEGLSPVSCERADSIVGAWADKLHWNVDVVYTKGTKWRGIWPEGLGLKVDIFSVDAPADLMLGGATLFSQSLQNLMSKKRYPDVISLFRKRISRRIRSAIAGKGFVFPHEIAVAEKWGLYLSALKEIKSKQYDFIFVCVGHGDEYLLQTALTLSETLKMPMIVDFRDLWSEHHVPSRFTTKQRSQIHRMEQKLLAKTVLISVPQRHMAKLLKKWVKVPVYQLTHSAYVDDTWDDGGVVSDKFTMLYAGKLYADGPGLKMLLELIKDLSAAKLYKPFKCSFFVDNTKLLDELSLAYGVKDAISINEWVSPSMLWKSMRSAHVLVIPDAGVAEDFPLLPTKTFQYAHTGRQILSLSPYKNEEMKEFLAYWKAGMLCNTVEEAANWITSLSYEKSQYESLPPLRNVAMREAVAVQFGIEIEKVLEDE